jgi:hypothetical protein
MVGGVLQHARVRRAQRPCASWLTVLRANAVASPVTGSSAVGSCGDRLDGGLMHDELYEGLGARAEASCAVTSSSGLGRGLVCGELQRRAQRPCAVSSRQARARWRPHLMTVGSTLPRTGCAARMAWSWGCRCQDLKASVLVGPVLLCSSGEVRLTPVTIRI